LPTPVSTRLLVASFGSRVAMDYAARFVDGGKLMADLSQAVGVDELRAKLDVNSIEACILFLNSRLSENERRALEHLVPLLQDATFIGVVSTFRVHIDDEAAVQAEAQVLDCLQRTSARVVVFRPGQILSASSRPSRLLRAFGFAYPLIPRSVHSCFVDGDELFDVIELERRLTNSESQESPQRERDLRHGFITLLGPNESLRDVLKRNGATGFWQTCLTCICFVFALLLVGHVAALIFDLLARRFPSLRQWNVGTLRPRSLAELLALCNRHNVRHVKVVGYNNGVVHFGHRFPGKTVVSTVRCNRIVRADADVIKADCGATIRNAMDFLAPSNQELPVIPNYSYVCLGTAFFVPIHGSASDVTTVAETITKVMLYDPQRDRIILATSDEPAFRETVYNLASNAIVLRLWLRVKPKARYFARHETFEEADASALLNILRDPEPTNVEIRKAKASSRTVSVATYYTTSGEKRLDALEIPRDTLGRLWDRLEENAITSFLMHAFARTMIWHVELFFSAEDFAKFWQTHQALPVKKIQLRYIRRDGLPHSPFREHDCVSVDLFMFRWNRSKFEAFLKQTFAFVRSNPGKHSQ